MNCINLIYEDLKKVASHNIDAHRVLYCIRYLLTNDSFKYTFWFRVGSYLKYNKGFSKVFYPIAYLMYKHYTYKYCIQIPLGTSIGGGVSFNHFGAIIINRKAIIGNQCTIFSGTTLGVKIGGKNQGVPIIGNNCVLGPGCKIIGNVKIGNSVFVGANSVVTHNIDDNCVIAGCPAKVLNYNGKEATDLVRKHK